jgi:thiol-disulfide isomerase/thioredoxin
VKPRTGLAIAIVASALAGAATYAVFRDGAGTGFSGTADAGDPAQRAAAKQVAADDTGAPKLATELPVFTLGDLENKPRTLQDWPNKALIVNFWATWCAPCRREIPLLKKLQSEHGSEGFQVIGIAVDFRDKVVPYAKDMRIDYPILIGEQDALDAVAAFGVDAIGFPFTVFSDRQGRIVAAHQGELTAAQADVILAAIRRVDAGADSLEQARTSIETGLAEL